MSACFAIVGGGQAGAQAIDSLRRAGFDGRLVLIGEEDELPYQRPALSKQYLSGELAAERLAFRHRAFYEEHRVELKLGVRVKSLHPDEHTLVMDFGQSLRYDRVLLCLGASSRQLTCVGANKSGIHYLRGLGDVPAIKSSLTPGTRVVIIGGGYIGLETAATARKLGCAVTVLEMADRVMNRVVASNVSAYFEDEHRRRGVKIICNARIDHLAGNGRVQRVMCADGTSYECDVLIAGVGSIPNVEIAQNAGLHCDNGIVVDEYCRTSATDVFAAGDCANHPSLRFDMRVRLESVDNAVEQAKAAAMNMIERPTVHDRVPWFWSDQFDNKLLIVGLAAGHDQQVTRGDPASRSFTVCYLKGGELQAVEAVNHVKDYMAARKLIAERAKPSLERLANPGIAMKEVIAVSAFS